MVKHALTINLYLLKSFDIHHPFVRILVTVCICLSSARAEQPPSDADDSALRRRIDEFVDGVRECYGVPGLTLAVVRNGQVRSSYGQRETVLRCAGSDASCGTERTGKVFVRSA